MIKHRQARLVFHKICLISELLVLLVLPLFLEQQSIAIGYLVAVAYSVIIAVFLKLWRNVHLRKLCISFMYLKGCFLLPFAMLNGYGWESQDGRTSILRFAVATVYLVLEFANIYSCYGIFENGENNER